MRKFIGWSLEICSFFAKMPRPNTWFTHQTSKNLWFRRNFQSFKMLLIHFYPILITFQWFISWFLPNFHSIKEVFCNWNFAHIYSSRQMLLIIFCFSRYYCRIIFFLKQLKWSFNNDILFYNSFTIRIFYEKNTIFCACVGIPFF